MTTPKWMLGLMACAALLVAQCDSDNECSDEDCGCPETAMTTDAE